MKKKRKRRRKGKKTSVHPHQLHARRRSLERLGKPLTRELEGQLISKIRKEGPRLRAIRQSNSRTLFEIPLADEIYYVLYSRSTGHLVTVLTTEMGRTHFPDE